MSWSVALCGENNYVSPQPSKVQQCVFYRYYKLCFVPRQPNNTLRLEKFYFRLVFGGPGGVGVW